MKKKTTTKKTVAGRFGTARPAYSPIYDERTAYDELRYRLPIHQGEVGPFIGTRKKAVILDIDGTVESWGAGLNSKLMPWLEKHYKAGHTFVVITARDEWMYETSFNSMMRILPYPFVGPFLRPSNDRRYAAEFKRELAESLSFHYEFVGAADDDSYVLKMFRQWAIDHFDDPKDFDIFEAGYGAYKDWRKDLPSKGTIYGGTQWKSGTYTPPAGYTPKNRPAGMSAWSGPDLSDNPAWAPYFSAEADKKVTRGDDEFDDLSQGERYEYRFDLEDDVLASYPHLKMSDVIKMDVKVLEQMKADALALKELEDTAPLDVAEVLAEMDEKPRTPRKNRKLTKELLTEVATAYLNAPQGGRQAAAGKVLGIDAHRASYYIAKARERGLLDAPSGDMRTKEVVA